jgi:hypothetical protein
MIYDLATLSGPLLKLGEIDSGAQKWMAEAGTGMILGRWRADIGTLGRIILLRQFDTQQALMEERRRTLLCRNPFNGNGSSAKSRRKPTRASLFCLPPNRVSREAFMSFGLIS